MLRLALEDGSYSAWLTEHYAPDMQGMKCKRCGEYVDYLTLHARNVHEDDINVLPLRNTSGAFHDEAGRQIMPPSWAYVD
jgi:hypothetical protein